MRLRSAKDVIDVAKARGMRIRIDPGPPVMPVLVRPEAIDRDLVTDALLAALRAWRLEIIEAMQGAKERVK